MYKRQINNCSANWWIALVAIVVVIICNIWGKGMVKIIPILLGVIASYAVAAVSNNVDFTLVKEADWFGLPIIWQNTGLSVFTNGDTDWGMVLTLSLIHI